MPESHEAAVEVLNSLLRCERAAMQTYRHAEAQFDDLQEAELLRQIARDHGHVASELRAQVFRMGGEAGNDSGLGGDFTRFGEGSGMLLGKAAALNVLKEGEQLGVSRYEAALKNENLPLECHILISNSFLLNCTQHIYHLNQMIDLQ